MLCIDNRCTDIYFNLAAEEYLLKRKRENYFMLWRSEPSVVIGKHQSAEIETDENYMKGNGIRLARRFSGGGAVYHDKGNINLTFIETIQQPDFEFYLQQVIDFLETIGITAHADKRLGVYVDGLKISGSAQCIHKDRVMYHCTLLFSTDLIALNKALSGKTDADELVPGSRTVRAVPSVRSNVTNISNHLLQQMDIKRFMHLIYHYFLNDNENNRLYRFTREEIASIERLKAGKYADEGWTYNKASLNYI